VEVLHALAPQCGVVFAVDVESKDNALFEGVPDYGDSISGWYLAWRWLQSKVGLAPPLRIPSLSELALRVSYIAHNLAIRELLDSGDESLVYVRCTVGEHFRVLDYHRAPEIVAMGYEQCTAALDRWLQRRAAQEGGGEV
jgi:hypothetical protein